MKAPAYESWGRLVRAHRSVVPLHWRTDDPFQAAPRPVLAYGLGRSYGDSCLNEGGSLLATRGLDRFIALDVEKGLLACEAGVSLGEILELVVPHGLFLPVVPGTKHVTVGGAIANDVHGKNHHRAGTFGCHVVEVELLRSNGQRVLCSRKENPALFAATVGGLGLTGLMLAVTLRLVPIPSARIRQGAVPLPGLDFFFEHSARSDAEHEFTVAWVDCLARGAQVGKGILFRGGWAEPDGKPARPVAPRRARVKVPFDFPFSPLNRLTLKAFNAAYYARSRAAGRARSVAYEPFFFPLDGVDRWNRVYGRRGLLQFQCQVPHEAAPVAIRAMLNAISAAGDGSFLAVLKNFGETRSPGLLSFPREGVTLALDFPNRGERSARLFGELHAMVAAHGGRLYPAKDAHMPPGLFQAQYRDVLPAFRASIDPAFSSSFWRRVMPDA
jgi:FAD/FMN-containing dehydrogenase